MNISTYIIASINIEKELLTYNNLYIQNSFYVNSYIIQYYNILFTEYITKNEVKKLIYQTYDVLLYGVYFNWVLFYTSYDITSILISIIYISMKLLAMNTSQTWWLCFKKDLHVHQIHEILYIITRYINNNRLQQQIYQIMKDEFVIIEQKLNNDDDKINITTTTTSEIKVNEEHDITNWLFNKDNRPSKQSIIRDHLPKLPSLGRVDTNKISISSSNKSIISTTTSNDKKTSKAFHIKKRKKKFI